MGKTFHSCPAHPPPRIAPAAAAVWTGEARRKLSHRRWPDASALSLAQPWRRRPKKQPPCLLHVETSSWAGGPEDCGATRAVSTSRAEASHVVRQAQRAGTHGRRRNVWPPQRSFDTAAGFCFNLPNASPPPQLLAFCPRAATTARSAPSHQGRAAPLPSRLRGVEEIGCGAGEVVLSTLLAGLER